MESNAVDILQADFLTPFRDFARQAIGELIASVPELRTNDQWWTDIETYNQTNSYGNIIDTTGRAPDVNNFDHNGAAKWLMRMYVQPDGVLLNPYLLNHRSPVQVTGCAPQEYSRALAAYIDLRNNFLGHGGADAENMTSYDLLCHASLVIWLTRHLNCRAQYQALPAMESRREDVARQCGMSAPDQYASPEAERQLMNHTLDWSRQRQEARAAARVPRRDRSALPFEQWPVAAPMPVAPWESVIPQQLIFPGELDKGRPLPRTYTPYMPCIPSEIPQPEAEQPEADYSHRKKFLAQLDGPHKDFDPSTSIGVKVLNGLAAFLYMSAYLLIRLCTLGLALRKAHDYTPDAGHMKAYRDMIAGAAYDIKAGIDRPFTLAGWLSTVLLLAVTFLDFLPGWLVRGGMAVLPVLNYAIALVIFVRICMRGIAGLKARKESNFMMPGLATPLLSYMGSGSGIVEKLFFPVMLLLALEVCRYLPALCGVWVTLFLSLDIWLFGKKEKVQ